MSSASPSAPLPREPLRVFLNHLRYYEPTIYGKLSETAADASLVAAFDVRPLPVGRRTELHLRVHLQQRRQYPLLVRMAMARARRYDAGRFPFHVKKGRCETCEGEGFVCVELLFLASVYAPCSTCHGARYNAKTLEMEYRGRNIADVLTMTVERPGRRRAPPQSTSRGLWADP